MRLTLFISIIFSPLILSADTLTLQEALNKTLNGNLPIQVATLRTEQAAVNNSPGAAGMLPSVGVSAGKNTSIQDTRQQFYTGDDRVNENAKSAQTTAGVNASWQLFDGLEMFALKQKLEELERFAGLQARLVTESELAAAAITYIQISLAEQQVRVMDSVLSYSRERTRFSRQNWTAGAGSELEFLQAQVDFTADSLALVQAEMEVLNLKAGLNRLMGHKADSAFQVSKVIPQTELLIYNQLLESARDGNPEVIMARAAEGIAVLEIRQARAGRLPGVTGVAGYNYSKSTSEAGLLQSNQAIGPSVGISLQYNLFNGGAVNRAVKTAELERRIASLDLNLALLELEELLYQTFNQYVYARTRAEVEQARFDVASRSARIGYASYRAGAISFLQFRDIQEQYLQAGFGFYNALFEAKRNEILLMQYSGRMLN